MNQYLEKFFSLKDPERKQVVAAAKWGDGPYTRFIFKAHFPKIRAEDIPDLIVHLRTLEA